MSNIKKIKDSLATAPDVVPGTPEASSPLKADQVASHREAELLEGETTRVVDGRKIKEKTRADFVHITKFDDERVIKRDERSSMEIAGLLDRGPGPGKPDGCALHGTPGCTPCRLVEESLRTIVPGSAPKVDLPIAPTNEEVAKQKIHRARKSTADKRRKRNAAVATEDTSAQAEADKEARERNKISQVYGVKSARAEGGYSIREILRCLTRPDFNEEKITVEYMKAAANRQISKYRDQIIRFGRKRFPRTLADLETLLPQKTQTLFSIEELAFYRDSTGGNFTKTQMKERIDAKLYRPLFVDEDTLVEIENKIIRRAWDLGSLPRKRVGGVDDPERDLAADHDLEAASGVGGDTTIKAGYGSTEGKTWTPMKTNTFERGPYHRKKGNHGDGEEPSTNLEDQADGDPLD